jgi:hypothetical protein
MKACDEEVRRVWAHEEDLSRRCDALVSQLQESERRRAKAEGQHLNPDDFPALAELYASDSNNAPVPFHDWVVREVPKIVERMAQAEMLPGQEE